MLLVGSNSADDAGVYQINETEALVVTTDFFPPIVDDPLMFGQIAAANALSDIYAMGARPLTALNLLCFPHGKLSPEVMHKILLGGHQKVVEAGAVIAGGHSIKDAELKYGLAITGIVEIDKLKTNAGAKPGDKLILTKPLGTGIVSTAMKKGIADDDLIDTIVNQMAQLNRRPSEIASDYNCSAVTDVTGNGLIGHSLEMAEASGATIRLFSGAVPLIPETVDLAIKGCLTGGGKDNRMYCEPKTTYETPIDDPLNHILHDPQTSGGLLIAIHDDDAGSLLREIQEECESAAVVGEVLKGDSRIVIS